MMFLPVFNDYVEGVKFKFRKDVSRCLLPVNGGNALYLRKNTKEVILRNFLIADDCAFVSHIFEAFKKGSTELPRSLVYLR